MCVCVRMRPWLVDGKCWRTEDDFKEAWRSKGTAAKKGSFEDNVVSVMKELKAAIGPTRKRNLLVLAGNLQQRHLNLEGIKLLFLKARGLRCRNNEANLRAFDKAVRDVMVKTRSS